MTPQKFNIGSLRFQQGSRIVERENETPVKLSYQEYSILLVLCTTEVYREKEKKRIDNVIYRLRGKLGLEAQIVCDWKQGYRLLNATQVPS